jgi:hypothetical protein
MILKILVLLLVLFHLALWFAVTKKMFSHNINLSGPEKIAHCIAMLLQPIIGPVVEYKNLRKANPNFK